MGNLARKVTANLVPVPDRLFLIPGGPEVVPPDSRESRSRRERGRRVIRDYAFYGQLDACERNRYGRNKPTTGAQAGYDPVGNNKALALALLKRQDTRSVSSETFFEDTSDYEAVNKCNRFTKSSQSHPSASLAKVGNSSRFVVAVTRCRSNFVRPQMAFLGVWSLRRRTNSSPW